MLRRLNWGALLNFFLFISFSLGIILGRYFPSFLIFLIFFLIFFSLTYLFYRKNRLLLSDFFILLAFLFLGALWQISASSANIDKFLNRQNRVILKVISLPKSAERSNSFTAQIEEINGYPLTQKIKVRDYSKSLQYLKRYCLTGKLNKRKYQQRWFYHLWIKALTQSQELSSGIWDKFIKKSTQYILEILRRNCSQQGYRFLAAIFLGRRELLLGERDFFAAAGVSHLLAISGLHIGLTSLILFFFLRFFNLPFRACLAISLVFLYFYTFLTGASPATLRAAIMYSVFAFSFFLKRRPSVLNSLGLAGLIILLTKPSALFTIGFQLSFAAVFAIIMGYKVFIIKPVNNICINYLKQIFFCSLFVTVFITPLVSHYFGKIYILSIVYNLILIPFFTFILMINFLLLIFSPLNFFAQSLGAVLSVLISFFIDFIQALSSLSFSSISYRFSAPAIFIYYFLLAVILTFLKLHSLGSKGL